jgi:hypothetical protein
MHFMSTSNFSPGPTNNRFFQSGHRLSISFTASHGRHSCHPEVAGFSHKTFWQIFTGAEQKLFDAAAP